MRLSLDEMRCGPGIGSQERLGAGGVVVEQRVHASSTREAYHPEVETPAGSGGTKGRSLGFAAPLPRHGACAITAAISNVRPANTPSEAPPAPVAELGAVTWM